MNDAVRIAPRGQSRVGRAEDCTPRRVPERQLAGRVEVERSPHRPGLDERPPLPQRGSDVGLHGPLQTRGELQLGRGLHLGVHAADGARDVDEPVGARPLVEGRAGQPARPHLIPVHLHDFAIQGTVGGSSRRSALLPASSSAAAPNGSVTMGSQWPASRSASTGIPAASVRSATTSQSSLRSSAE